MISSTFASLFFLIHAFPVLAHATDATDSSVTYIEPDVHRYTNVLPKDVCKKLIKMGEAAGFPLDFESIDEANHLEDTNTTQAIEVLTEEGDIENQEIFDLIEPYIPNIEELIRGQRNEVLDRLLFPNELPNRMPKLGWIFYRKYAPDTARSSLPPHYDTNMFTVNIALNDDYTGGGVFLIKPKIEDNLDWDPNQEEHLYIGEEGDGVPHVNEERTTYEWTSKQRKNSTDVLFPIVETGDAIIHNYTVWHAVAPVEKGTRYSLVLFYDMHNPVVNGELAENDDDDDDEDDEDEFDVKLEHAFKECDPTTGKLELIEDGIEVLWVDRENNELEEHATLSPGEVFDLFTFPEHVFLAVRSVPEGASSLPLKERKVLATIEINTNKTDYEIVNTVSMQEDCKITSYLDANEL